MGKDKKGANKLLLLWHSHPRIAILLCLVVINLSIILLFTGILTLVSRNNFFYELAYVFAYTMNPDGLYDFVNSQEDLICFIIKVVLTVIQMIIFSGALIGFSTDFLQTTIDKSINNIGKINLKNHYVFLNWSSIGPQIIYDLSFLDGEKNIVILSDYEREIVLNSIHNIFVEHGRKLQNVRVFVKEGSPTSVKHLDDISIGKAKYVGILLSNQSEITDGMMPSNDLNALKMLLNIVSIASQANIVVEAECEESVKQIDKLISVIDKDLKKRVIAFSHNGVIGNILGKTTFNSNYSKVYHELLSYDGAEFYGINPMDIDEALYAFNDCIPIINYDDDDEVDEFGNKNVEQLYILSDTESTLGIRKEKVVIDRRLCIEKNIVNEPFTLFVFSNDNKSKFVIEEIMRYSKDNNIAVDVYSYKYNEEMEKVINDISNTKGKKKILLLSDINEGIESQDTNIFLSALTLKVKCNVVENVEILTEIVNPSNYNSLRNIGVMSVIMSNKIISLFMVQLLTHPGSRKFYRDIISTNDSVGDDAIDIELIKAGEIIKFEEEYLSFTSKTELVQSFYFSTNKKMMCIGYIPKNSKEIMYLCDKMDVVEDIKIYQEDELVVVMY